MNSALTRPAYWDIEISTLSYMLEHGMWKAHEISMIEHQLEDRKAQILAGLGSASQIFWTAKIQKEVDENCRVRHDPILGWMLDRWIEDLMCWHPVGYIGTGGKADRIVKDGIDTVVTVDDMVRPDIVQYLKDHDMQRPGYLEHKAAMAEAVREYNKQKSTDKVLAAVDSLSNKQVREFVEVEKAIQTGDTVIMHGPCREMFDKLTEAGKKAPPGPQSLNPGMNPFRHRRDYSKPRDEGGAL